MEEQKFEIKGLERCSLVEWPGKMASIMFLGGCNFRCPFCHNPELVNNPNKVPTFPWEEIEKFLNQKKGWIDAIMITGGEPTLQPKLPELCKTIKERGYLVGVETNGTNPKMIEELLKKNLLDKISMDVKNRIEKYPETVGKVKVNIGNIRKSIEIIKKSSIFYEFRTTVVPGLIDEQDMEEIGKLIKGAKVFVIQQFRPIRTLDKKYEDLAPYSREKLKKMKKKMEKYVDKVSLDFIN